MLKCKMEVTLCAMCYTAFYYNSTADSAYVQLMFTCTVISATNLEK